MHRMRIGIEREGQLRGRGRGDKVIKVATEISKGNDGSGKSETR